MTRRRLIIEWDDEGTDTDEECRNSFLAGDWTIEDLQQMQSEVNLTVKVSDAV